MSTWFVLREPGCVPRLKGPFPAATIKRELREFIGANPRAFITVLSICSDGSPMVDDGPEVLEILDGRSAPTAARHRDNTRRAFAEAAL